MIIDNETGFSIRLIICYLVDNPGLAETKASLTGLKVQVEINDDTDCSASSMIYVVCS